MKLFYSKAFALVAVLSTTMLAGFNVQANERWEELRSAFFADREIGTDESVILLETPSRAMDAAVVPVIIRTTNQYKDSIENKQQADETAAIKKIHLIVDQNPLPLAGVFTFSDSVEIWDSLETNIRINEYTDVRAIAEMADGSLHMVNQFVKASGGCSAPAMADLETAIAGAGQLDILLGDINNNTAETMAGSSTEAVLRISHPNNSGMQFDQISRNYIPAFFISEIGLQADNELLLEVATNFSLSENPVVKLAFNETNTYNNLQLYAIDSRGNRFEKIISLDAGRATLDGDKATATQ